MIKTNQIVCLQSLLEEFLQASIYKVMIFIAKQMIRIPENKFEVPGSAISMDHLTKTNFYSLLGSGHQGSF